MISCAACFLVNGEVGVRGDLSVIQSTNAPTHQRTSHFTAFRSSALRKTEREVYIDNLLIRIHFIIVMIKWTVLAPWEFESPFPSSRTSTFLIRKTQIVFTKATPSINPLVRRDNKFLLPSNVQTVICLLERAKKIHYSNSSGPSPG